MTNIRLWSIDQYVDVSTKNNFYTYHLKDDIKDRLKRIHLSSRDSSRTPMQWSGDKNGGFSKAKPWFYVNPNYKRINVKNEEQDPESILNFYRKCLALRKSSKTLILGAYREYFPKDPNVYMYERSLGKVRYLIVCSFSRLPMRLKIPRSYAGRKGQLLLCNYPQGPQVMADKLKDRIKQEVNLLEWQHGMLRPYEARVYRFRM